MNRRRVMLTVVSLAVVALLAGLAGGCGGGNSVAETGITGFIVDVGSGLGIGNVEVRARGQSGTSRTADGLFKVTGVAPGNGIALEVQPGPIFVPVPGPAPSVNVVARQLTDIGTVLVIDRNNLPPG